MFVYCVYACVYMYMLCLFLCLKYVWVLVRSKDMHLVGN